MRRRLPLRYARLLALPLIVAPLAGAAPDKSVLRAQEGATALLRGKFEQALSLYDEALRDTSLPPAKLASLYNDRGVAKWRLQRYDEAVADFNKAVETYPQYASLYNNRGNVLLEMERAEDAIKDFDKAIALAPGYGAAYNNRANANHQMKRYDAALNDYAKAIENMPANAVPYNGRGKTQGLLGRPFSALRYLSRALTLNGKYPAAYRNRAEIYQHLERYKDAQGDYDRVIALSPEDAQLYMGRGRTLSLDGKPQFAHKDFSKAIELDPSIAAAYAERGAMSNELRNYAAALEDLDQAITLDAELPPAYYQRARAYFRTNNITNALADLEKALSLDPRYAEAYQLRGEISEAQGLPDPAIADYRQAFQHDPFSQAAKDGIRRLSGEVVDYGSRRIGEAVSEWEIVSPAPNRYVAVNFRYPKIKIVLEVYGKVAPQIIEWTPIRDPSGIGLLRYFAGQSPAGKRYENVVIIDTAQSQVVTIEPYIWGDTKAKWDWTQTDVTVTDAEGISTAYNLRKPKPVARPDDGFGSLFGDSRGRGRQKGLFDWIFN
jgi:tetratricopeptide (TPR) repeat protein